MGQAVVIKNKGLNTAPNEFSSVPEGSLVVADNCTIDQDNLLEPRRGLLRKQAFAAPGDRARRFTLFQEKVVVAYSGGKIAYDNAGTWANYSGTYNDVDATTKIKFLLAGSNCYFTSSNGIFRLDAYNGTPKLAGVPKGLDLQLAATGVSGFLSDDNQVAYRMVWGFKDANNTLFLSAPSGRASIINVAAIPPALANSFDVIVTFTIPTEITTSHFYQIYRSPLSGAASVEPSDEMGLVFENYPTAGEIVAGLIVFTDSTPDSLRGATLYTSPSQDGIIQANERPPLAKDICTFQNSVFAANCTSKNRRKLTLLSASALTLGTQITIAGTVYTVSNTETIASGNFKKFTAGTPAQNIADTADSLIRVINRYASNTLVYATLLSGPNDLPGQILIEERTIGGAAFSVIASADGTAFNPVLPVSGTTVSSSSDAFSNQLFFSRTDKPESFPLINYLFIGSRNNKILRIFPLKNTLFVFKENEGIYRVTGSSASSFSVDLFDSSASLLAPETVDLVNNQIWCLSDQGLVTITETGVQVISRPIEDIILGLSGEELDALKNVSFGFGYETDRRYVLFTVTTALDTFCTQSFTWNTFTRAFTRWDKTASAGFVSPLDKKIYLGEGNSNFTLQERKNFDFTDYADYAVAVNISSFVGKNITLSTVVDVAVGDILTQGTVKSGILSILGNVVTVADLTSSWTVAAASVLKAYLVSVEYSPITAGNPGTLKQWPELSLLFKTARFNSASVAFSTDVSSGFEKVPFNGFRNGMWGLFPWGQATWGLPTLSLPVRVYVPTEKQMGSYLKVKFEIKEAMAPWKLNGISVPLREINSFFIAK